MTYPRGHASLAERKALPELVRCESQNWVNQDRCLFKTRTACGDCGKAVCGIHVHDHRGDYRTACKPWVTWQP